MIKFCRSCCGGAHTFVRSNKSMQKCICGRTFRRLAKTISTNQRKVSFLSHAHRRQLGRFFLSPSKCKRYTVFHIFSLPSVWYSKRSPIHVGSLEGFVLSPTKYKRCTDYHIFSFADVCDCRRVGLWNSLVIIVSALIFHKLRRRHLYFFISVSRCANWMQARTNKNLRSGKPKRR